MEERDQALRDSARGRTSPEIAGANPTLPQESFDRPLDATGGLLLPHVAKQLRARHDGRERVGEVLSRDIGGRAVHGLEERVAFAHVRAGYEPEPADQARAQIRDDVTVEVFQHQDVELRGTADQL